MSLANDRGGLSDVLAQAVEQFRRRFGRAPRYAAAAPGRVNLIGEHTDYNGGFVLPMAIDRYAVLVADRGPNGRDWDNQTPVRLYSADLDAPAQFKVDASLAPEPDDWSNYIRGVVAGCVRRGMNVGGFDAVIASSVPLGGGLSSSASLEVATATLIEALTGQRLELAEKALLCQRAEHEFAGVPCGIMDQFTSVMGRTDRLMLLDCRSLETTLVPLVDPNVTVLIINSNVRHALTGGEYARRHKECELAAQALVVPQLRDATIDELSSMRGKLDALLYRRARHVISEIERTVAAANAIAKADWQATGALMYQSHESLKDDFEVSCAELDLLVELARSLGPRRGVIGSRMTGAGFGGCTVSLVRTEEATSIAETISEQYRRETNVEPTWFVTRPAEGAQIVDLQSLGKNA